MSGAISTVSNGIAAMLMFTIETTQVVMHVHERSIQALKFVLLYDVVGRKQGFLELSPDRKLS